MWQRLASWLGLNESDGAAAAGAAAARAGAEAPEQAAADEFAARLVELCQDRQIVSIGRLHILNTAAIKARFGDTWPAVSEKVTFVIQRTFEQCLAPGDFHANFGDDIHVVIFANLTVGEAAAKCAGIAHEIMTKLFGDVSGAALIEIESAAVDPDGRLIRESIDPAALMVSALSHAVAEQGSGPAAAKREPAWRDFGRRAASEARAEPAWKLSKSMSARFGMDEGGSAAMSAVEPPHPAAPTATDGVIYQKHLYDLMRLISDTGKSIDDWRRFGSSHVAQHFDALVAKAPAAAPTRPAAIMPTRPWVDHEPKPQDRRVLPQLPDLSGAEFSYQPVWFAPKRAITTHHCKLYFRRAEGLMTIDEVFGDADAPDIKAMVDMLILRKALSDAARLTAQGDVAIITASAHYSTLFDRSTRGQWLGTCSEATEPLRQLLVIELLDLYTAEWKQLRTIVAQLKKVVRAVILRVSLDHPVTREMAELGVQAVGGDLREQQWTETRALNAFWHFVEQCQQHDLLSYVNGLDTNSLRVAALAAGFDYLAGGSVMAPVPAPFAVRPFELANLYLKS